jgi:hypothetical protein
MFVHESVESALEVLHFRRGVERHGYPLNGEE